MKSTLLFLFIIAFFTLNSIAAPKEKEKKGY